MSEGISGHNSRGRPRKWESDAERKAAKRQEAHATDEQARRDEEFIQAELAITRAQYERIPVGTRSSDTLDERMQRSEAYLRKWVAGEIGPRSK